MPRISSGSVWWTELSEFCSRISGNEDVGSSSVNGWWLIVFESNSFEEILLSMGVDDCSTDISFSSSLKLFEKKRLST